jgi:hypothetical protein
MISYTDFRGSYVMLYKGLSYVFSLFSSPVPEPPASMWSLRDQLRVGQFVAPLSLDFLGIMGIFSVSFKWSRKEGMKHNFWSRKVSLFVFLPKMYYHTFWKECCILFSEFQCVS